MRHKITENEFRFISAAIGSDTDLWKQVIGGKDKDENYDIEFRVNGVDLDFSKAAASLLDDINKEITLAAQALVDEECSDLLHVIHHLTSAIKETSLDRLGIDVTETW